MLALGIAFWATVPSSAQAQVNLNCSNQFLIDETLPSGSRWQLCWEYRARDGIVLREITFTPVNGTQRMVLFEASIAQIHVPYDDNGARYHDVTDYGLGDRKLNNLTSADCPDGTLIAHENKNMLCKRISRHGHAFTGGGIQRQGYVLSLFSVSHVGSYNYIPLWQFYDDGTIEPLMGATGKLQRYGNDSSRGWLVRPEAFTNRIGISHTHNYYWKLDFDLNGTGDNDIVEEIEFVPTNESAERTLSVTPLNQEAARSVEMEKMRTWRIRDGAATNADGRAISYQFEPLRVGHRDEGPDYEPWTFNDFYVTKEKGCEDYASKNPATNGCASDLSTFVNGENIVGADIVTWYGVTFHHIPRDEDENYMHTHWDGFKLVPRDWTAGNALAAGLSLPTETPVPPTATDTPTETPVPTQTFTPIPTDTQIPPTATGTPAAPITTPVEPPTNTPTGIPLPTETITSIATFTPIDTGTPTHTLTPTDTAQPTATEIPKPTNTPLPTAAPTGAPPNGPEGASTNNVIYISSTSGGTVGGIRYSDEDILAYDVAARTWTVFVDGSDIGLASTDVDAFAVLGDGSLLFSISVATSIPPLGIVDDSDIIRFVPSALGPDTEGTLELYFDGSDVGLSTNSEDIKAITALPDGRLVVSTTGQFSVDGISGQDEDLALFTPSTLGESTSGTWALTFDGSHVGMGDSSYEDIWGTSIDPTGEIHITTRRSFAVLGLTGSREAIFTCIPSATGTDTACLFQTFWRGTDHGIGGETLDAIHVGTSANN